MNIIISGRKYVYCPIGLRREELTGKYEVIKAPSALVLVKEDWDPDEVIQSIELVLEDLRLRRTSSVRRWE